MGSPAAWSRRLCLDLKTKSASEHKRFVHRPLRVESRGQPNRSVFRCEGSLLGAQYQIGLVSRGRDGPWQVTRALKRKEPLSNREKLGMDQVFVV